jgi:hypothetical protein
MLAGRTDGRHAWDDGHVDGVFGGTGYHRVMLYKAVKFETVVGIFRKTKTMRKKKTLERDWEIYIPEQCDRGWNKKGTS